MRCKQTVNSKSKISNDVPVTLNLNLSAVCLFAAAAHGHHIDHGQ